VNRLWRCGVNVKLKHPSTKRIPFTQVIAVNEILLLLENPHVSLLLKTCFMYGVTFILTVRRTEGYSTECTNCLEQ
jgi:hypothetical protein